ncbi:MAG: hypothetical protein Q7R73_00810 [bacterium]|nr:hypothetical protein [bacterium]
MRKYNEHIAIVSDSFPLSQIKQMLGMPYTFFFDAHVQYPADPDGAHLTHFFTPRPIAEHERFVRWIVTDWFRWAIPRRIGYDVVFGPNEPGTNTIIKEFADYGKSPLGKRIRYALWDYKDTGRFGDVLVEGEIKSGDKVFVFNTVSSQGRCVGQRLPSFVEGLGGTVVARAVFAKGTTSFVKEVETRYAPYFYAAVQVDIPVYTKEECPKCKAGDIAKPWTDLLKT